MSPLPPLPTEKEINPFDDLDGRKAAANLVGKDVREAANLLKVNSMCYGEDYSWMGPTAFCYYAPALVEYLRSKESDMDMHFAYFMPSTFRHRLDHDKEAVMAAVPTMREFCACVETDFDRLNFDDDYRRRFYNRVRELEAAIDRVSHSSQRAFE